MSANKTSAPKSRVELKVKDFGPIAKAMLDLRPLTVLVGPSNTGKSYLAIFIYALHRLWGAEIFGPRYLGTRASSVWSLGDFADVPEQVIDEAVEFVKRITDHAGRPSPSETLILPTSIAEVIGRIFDRRGGHLDREIRRCFGIEKSAALIRRGARGSAVVTVRILHHDDSVGGEQNFRIGARDAEFRTTMPSEATLLADTALDDLKPWVSEAIAAIRGAYDSRRPQEMLNIYRSELLQFLATAIHPLIVGPLAGDAFYLPADRTGVMHAHNVVVSALIGSAAMAGVRSAARTPVLSGVLADFLEGLIELGRYPGARRRSRPSLGDGIEKTILKGSVRIESSEPVGYPHFTYSPEGWREGLSLANASSMVSELAPVVLYLRHMVTPGNMLIIEEPESHLHPAMQVQLTREIAALVQVGVRVVITTHSEWVLEELANVVGRFNFSGSEEPKLPASDVGVWLFEPKKGPKGSVVRAISLDDSGLYPTGFSEVAAALHNDWADISSSIQKKD